jgi:alkanesulfonate monooxygenase SsuD/methylene tetrahydromethanopterin reductase-like flavin-dependent oxidoreductase (luciferase family)
MQLGIALPQRGKDASVEKIARVAREAEAIGLDSVWAMDRLLRPLRPVQLLPGVDAQPLPEYYANVFDPIETLTYVAALTERVRLGTSAINALFHPPVVLARRLATLDQVSGGRVIAGIVQGWLADEFVVAGVPRTRRGGGMAEHVAASERAGADRRRSPPVSLDTRAAGCRSRRVPRGCPRSRAATPTPCRSSSAPTAG